MATFIPPWAATVWDLKGWTFEMMAVSIPLLLSSMAALSPASPPPNDYCLMVDHRICLLYYISWEFLLHFMT